MRFAIRGFSRPEKAHGRRTDNFGSSRAKVGFFCLAGSAELLGGQSRWLSLWKNKLKNDTLNKIIKEKAIGILAKERNVPEEKLRNKQYTTLAKYLKLRYSDGTKPHNKSEWSKAMHSWYQTNNRIVVKIYEHRPKNEHTDRSDARLLRDAAARAAKQVARKNGLDTHKYTKDSFLRTSEWKQIRLMALKKYGSKCMCCGATPESGAIMNVDHIKPRKLWPSLALDINNLQILCNDCNHGKGNWDMTDWRPKSAISQK